MKHISETTIMLFGSFDGIHLGHEYLIGKARELGKDAVIVVAQDSIILSTKKHHPKYTLQIRIESLQNMFPEMTITAGDKTQGTWSAIQTYLPTTVVVGYDQHGLKNALADIQGTYNFNIVQMDSFHPEKYKSSILRKYL